MLKDNKKSFFERLTGSIAEDNDDMEELDIVEEEYEEEEVVPTKSLKTKSREAAQRSPKAWETEDMYPEEQEGELSVDVYQTETEIIVEAMVAGVKPEDLHLNITRDMVTVKGRRAGNESVSEDDYFYRELYWGAFTRTILLPHEIDIEQSEAVEKHGLLIIRMPKLDKARSTKLKIKSI